MQSEPVRYHRDGAVGWISIDYPPVNVLGAAVVTIVGLVVSAMTGGNQKQVSRSQVS